MNKNQQDAKKHLMSGNVSTFLLRLLVLGVAFYILFLWIFVLPYFIFSDDTKLFHFVAVAVYISALPFFYGVFQTMKLLRYTDKNTAFSEESVAALKKIKYSTITIGILYVGILPTLNDLGPVGYHTLTPIANVFVISSFVIALFVVVLQKLLQNALRIKAENDLTV